MLTTGSVLWNHKSQLPYRTSDSQILTGININDYKSEHTDGGGLNEIRLAKYSRPCLRQYSINVVNINIVKLMT